jgi:hypothetical protein
MIGTIGKCAFCLQLRPPGELLAVHDRQTDAVYGVCRPGLDVPAAGRCFNRAVGAGPRWEVSLADPAAAREYDHRRGGPTKMTMTPPGPPGRAS